MGLGGSSATAKFRAWGEIQALPRFLSATSQCPTSRCPRVKRENWKEMKSERVHCANLVLGMSKSGCRILIDSTAHTSFLGALECPEASRPSGSEPSRPGVRSIQCTTPTACDAVFGDLEMYQSTGGEEGDAVGKQVIVDLIHAGA